MSRKKNEFLPITHSLATNNIYYELKQKCIKSILIIPLLNVHIDKYYFGSNYYIYIKQKFVKKISEKELYRQIQIENCKKIV